MTYLLWRHVVAAILLAAVMPRTVRQTTRRDWRHGAVLGFFLFGAFVTQTIGLQWTTPGKSGFITSFYIVVVPFLYWIVARRSPGWVQIGGAVLAAAGRPAAFGLVFGMDVLSWRFVAGPALILTGVIVIETLPGRRDAPNPADVLPRAD